MASSTAAVPALLYTAMMRFRWLAHSKVWIYLDHHTPPAASLSTLASCLCWHRLEIAGAGQPGPGRIDIHCTRTSFQLSPPSSVVEDCANGVVLNLSGTGRQHSRHSIRPLDTNSSRSPSASVPFRRVLARRRTHFVSSRVHIISRARVARSLSSGFTCSSTPTS